MKKLLAVKEYAKNVDMALLLVRLVCGLAFVFHGWGKMQAPMSWMGAEAQVPGVFQLLAAIAEFGGGIALMLGLPTRIGAVGIGFTMLVAVSMHRFAMGDPFVNMTGGRSYELAAVFFTVAVLLITTGPGRYSLDRKVFGVTKK